jgi:hypothetical protein
VLQKAPASERRHSPLPRGASPGRAAENDHLVAHDSLNAVFAMNEKRHRDCGSTTQTNFSFNNSSSGEVINMRRARLGEMSGLDLGIATFFNGFGGPNCFRAINEQSVKGGGESANVRISHKNSDESQSFCFARTRNFASRLNAI